MSRPRGFTPCVLAVFSALAHAMIVLTRLMYNKIMLLDVLPLLEDSSALLVTTAETYELLRCLEEITAPISATGVDIYGHLDALARLIGGGSGAGENEEETKEVKTARALKQLDVVRGALARCVPCSRVKGDEDVLMVCCSSPAGISVVAVVFEKCRGHRTAWRRDGVQYAIVYWTFPAPDSYREPRCRKSMKRRLKVNQARADFSS